MGGDKTPFQPHLTCQKKKTIMLGAMKTEEKFTLSLLSSGLILLSDPHSLLNPLLAALQWAHDGKKLCDLANALKPDIVDLKMVPPHTLIHFAMSTPSVVLTHFFVTNSTTSMV